MEFEIIFCTDGILRIKYGNKPMVPAKFIQENNPKYKNDFGFWTRFWEDYTSFEEGLTVSQFLSCLEPWSEFWQDLTHKNIQAFINESRKPVLVTSTDEHPLGWISLSYQTSIEPNTEYEKVEGEDRLDITEWLNQPKNVKLTGDWEIYGSYKLSGYSIGYQEQYGIDYSPMNELANLPLILEKKQVLVVSEWNVQRILGEDYKTFHDNSYGIRTLTSEGSKYVTTYIQGEKHHRLREVIEGFFWWFPSDPISRKEFNKSLDEAVEEIKEDSNVIPLFKNEADDKTEEDKKTKVVVAPGAFDSIIRNIDRKEAFWIELLSKAKDNDEVILKIGELKEAKPPENRVFSFIVEDKDLSTPYKKS